MKIIDKTPFQSEKGEMTLAQRLQGTLQYGPSWYAELEAQKAVIAQIDLVLEKGFTLIRNFTLVRSQIVEPLILIGPPGVFVLLVTPLKGFYEARGDQWNEVKGGRASPAPVNLLYRVGRLARALQVYINRQGVTLPTLVEPVLIASNPGMHIDSMRPVVRVVMSDAIRQFAASLQQARGVLRSEQAFDLTERIITPRPKEAAPAEPASSQAPTQAAEAPAESESSSRARAIFQAGEELKPFDPRDLSFAFDENAPSAGQDGLPESGGALGRAGVNRGGMRVGQWLLLAGMALIECCVLSGFIYFVFTGRR